MSNKKWRVIIFGLIGFALIASLFATHFSKKTKNTVQSDDEKILNLYNWGDYIDPDLLKKFTEQTGYQVNYSTFDSNESMYTKVKQGGTSFDITVPSEYMVEKMAKEGLLIPLDHTKITGMENYNPSFLNKSFDPNNQYSVPYFWGTLGILYNSKAVDASQVQHWNQLWDPMFKNKIMLIDSARDVLGFSLISLGKSVNTTSIGDLSAAKGKLDALMPNVKAIVDDEIKMYMEQGEAEVAVTYSGEAVQAMTVNNDLKYTVPSEGSNEWFDNLVIPKTAKHLAAAYAFINFMNEPENAAQNASYVGYATANDAAKKILPEDIQNDPSFYPDQSVLDRLQIYQDLDQQLTEQYNDAFLSFKMK